MGSFGQFLVLGNTLSRQLKNFMRPNAKRLKNYTGWRRTQNLLVSPEVSCSASDPSSERVLLDCQQGPHILIMFFLASIGRSLADCIYAFRQIKSECPRSRAGEECMESGRIFLVVGGYG